ncbi:MAG: hypothetical protein E7266_02635 [Lachnospiraceae bacterium]|nr:hypothetical protein [Lachnospiraceae bacterium]
MQKTIDIKELEFQPLNEETRLSIETHNRKMLKNAFISRLIISAYVAIFVAIFQCIAQIIAEKDITSTIVICIILFVLFNIVSFVFYLTKSKLVEFSEEAVTLDVTITRLLGQKQLKTEEKAAYIKHKKIWKKAKKHDKKEFKVQKKKWRIIQKELNKKIKELKANTPYEQEFVLPADFPKNPKPVYNVTPKPVYNKRRGYSDSSRIPDYVFFKCEQGECTSALDIADHDLFVKLKVGDNIRLVKKDFLDRTTYHIIPLK